MKIKVTCLICNKEKLVVPARAKTFKTCSKKCMGEYFKSSKFGQVTKICYICNKEFRTKESHLNRRRYCSKSCQGIGYSNKYLGKNNPNFRNRTITTDGYHVDHDGKTKIIHRAIVHEYFKISDTPKGFAIHHRNCNKLDNRKENLVLLNNSDHRWIHKEFGNAILNALLCGDIELDRVISFSKDKDKAKRLLSISILDQKIENSKVLY